MSGNIERQSDFICLFFIRFDRVVDVDWYSHQHLSMLVDDVCRAETLTVQWSVLHLTESVESSVTIHKFKCHYSFVC